ncbi:MAG: Holliday junction resolvase RuvX [Alphaproteobacteria bacterium]|nr:Holliday junction resolvase RuvX [Alphaproteobacteria bacterium]
MATGLLKDIAPDVPKKGALMGLDIGRKTIGLALCDPGRSFATPLQTIKRTRFTADMRVLAGIAQEFEVSGFVAGYPLGMDGRAGPRCQSVRDFVAEMLRFEDVVGTQPWVALWDERLSTVSVEEFVDNMVEKRKNRVNAKSSGLIDKLAAQIILQGALDYMQRIGL